MFFVARKLTTQKHSPQLGLFSAIGDQLNQKHPLYLLAGKIRWQVFEEAFKKHYSLKMGAPSKPIRLMVSLLILKHVRNLSDEALVEQWAENIYFQYFSGEQFFSPSSPCVPTELVAFRHRIGEEGMELILQQSVEVNDPPEDGPAGAVLSVDTTVQEKNITYPTDDKLYKKIIHRCWRIALDEGIVLRQSYRRVVKKLGYQQRFRHSRKGVKAARQADRRIKTIAGRLLRDIARKLPAERLSRYQSLLDVCSRVLQQKRGDSQKIYSLHEPEVKCYSKGKEHKKYEFGSKASVLVDQQTGIIMGALNFTETLHDSKTIPAVLEQYERLHGRQAAALYADRGYRGIRQYKSTLIHVPRPDKNITQRQRQGHSRRAAIEPVIGHLKKDYRLSRNYLKGVIGDNINLLLAAAAMNFKRAMNLWRTEAIKRWILNCKMMLVAYWNFIAPKLKPTF